MIIKFTTANRYESRLELGNFLLLVSFQTKQFDPKFENILIATYKKRVLKNAGFLATKKIIFGMTWQFLKNLKFLIVSYQSKFQYIFRNMCGGS